MTKRNFNQEFVDLMKKVKSSTNADLNVGNLATVVSYDSSNQTADVKPLIDDAGGRDESTIIQDCPVNKSALLKIEDGKASWGKLKKGDQVTILFLDRNIDNYDKSGSFKKDDERMHDINDAVVLGVIA